MMSDTRPTLAGFLRLAWQLRLFTPEQRQEIAEHLHDQTVTLPVSIEMADGTLVDCGRVEFRGDWPTMVNKRKVTSHPMPSGRAVGIRVGTSTGALDDPIDVAEGDLAEFRKGRLRAIR